MKYFIPRPVVAAAALATLAWIAPASGDTPPTPMVVPITVEGLPSPEEVAEHCKFIDDLIIGKASGSAPSDTQTANLVANPNDPFPGVSLKSDVTNTGDTFSFTDETTHSTGLLEDQRSGTRGIEAVVVAAGIDVGGEYYENEGGEGYEGPNFEYISNIYCYFNALMDAGLVAPQIFGEGPIEADVTEVLVFWGRGPCLLNTQADIESACEVYNGPPGDPTQQSAHYLQEHIVAPTEPVNVCGCPFQVGEAPEQRPARLCNPLLAPTDVGGCPAGLGNLTGFTGQATATIGENTCHRVVIGGRAFFIGDTCT